MKKGSRIKFRKEYATISPRRRNQTFEVGRTPPRNQRPHIFLYAARNECPATTPSGIRG